MMLRKTFLYYQRICQNLRPNVTIFNILYFYGDELADHPTLELEDCLLLDVHSGFFNIFTATHHMWRLYSPRAASGHSVPQCVQLTNAVRNLMISSYDCCIERCSIKGISWPSKESWSSQVKSQAAWSLLVKRSLRLKRLWKILQYFSRFYLPALLWAFMLRYTACFQHRLLSAVFMNVFNRLSCLR